MRSSILDYKWDIAGIKVIRSRARRKRPIISPGIIPAKNKSLTDEPDAMPYMIKGMIYDLKYSPSTSWKHVTGSFSAYFRTQLKPAALASSCKGLAVIIYYIASWRSASTVFKSSAPICPGADALPTAPKVIDEPKTSPQRRLITPVPAIDIVMIGRSA